MKLILILFASICLAANPHNQPPQPSGPISISLSTSNWQTITNGPVPLSNCCNGALTFNFPIEDGTHPSMNYLTVKVPGGKGHRGVDISGYHYITMRIQVQVTGTPVFNWILNDPSNTCDAPAKMHPFFEQAGDNYTQETFRWWGNPIEFVLPASNAVVDITVPLTPDQWSDVYGVIGTNALAGFQAALKNTQNVGMTFGGGCFAGHGLNINPGATYQLLVLSYGIQ